jgi:hypothetical protein
MPASVRRVQESRTRFTECLCFHKFPERRFERNEAEVKHRDLRGDFLQQSQPTH